MNLMIGNGKVYVGRQSKLYSYLLELQCDQEAGGFHERDYTKI